MSPDQLTGLGSSQPVESPKPRTGLVTLLFTDMVNSTALKQQLGDKTGSAFFDQHHQLVRQTLQPFSGAQEIETAGDSFLITFSTPSDAVQFALLLQGRLRGLSQESGVNARDRIGIHLGEVVIKEDQTHAKPTDLYGIQIDACARVMSLAKAGQVLMTRAVFDSARQVLKGEDIEGVGQLEWLNHGPYLLKGLDEPVEICEVRETGQVRASPPTNSEKAQRQVRADEEPVLGWRPAVGQLVPNTKWVLEQKLGEGGFGEVWVGRNQTLKTDRRVFKFCFRADRLRSLKREVTLFRLLKERTGEHPHIVRLYEVYFDQPPFYLEEEYVAGKDLRSWCEGQGGVEKVPVETRLEIVAQAAEGLQVAHDAGIIHRDVKPGNILISNPKGEGGGLKVEAKLTDFGIGQVVSQEYLAGMTKAGFTMTLLGSESSSHTGTQLYLAPELSAGKPASIRSDIYSLGVVLYQLLVGDFARPVTTDWTNDIPDPLLRDDLRHCFAGNPQDRFVGAGQLAKNLRAVPERRMELARRETEKAAVERAAYRRGMMRTVGVAAVIVAAVAGLALVALNQSRRAKAASAAETKQRRLAETKEVAARQISYASDMLLAARELEANELGGASVLLKRQIPQPGDKDLRGWEWRHLWARCQSDELFTLGTHSYEVTALAFLPDGRLVTGGLLGLTDDITIKVWDARTRRLLATSPFKKDVFELAISPDGRTIAVGGSSPEVALLDAQSLQVRTNLRAANFVMYVSFSPKGDYLATSGVQLDLWDTATLDHLVTLPGRGPIAFSPDGTRLASQSSTGKGLVLWQTSDRKLPETHESVLADAAIAFSPDGRRLASASWNGKAYLLDFENDAVAVLTNATASLRSVTFSPDGTILASSGVDQRINIYEAVTAKHLNSLRGNRGPIAKVAFSPDGQLLVSACKDSTIRIWDPKRPPKPYVTTNLPAVQPGFAVSRNGRYLATPDPEGNGHVWDLTMFREKSKFTAGQAARFYALCPSGRFVAGGETNGAVTVWDTIHDGKSYTRPLHRGKVNAVEFSPDGVFGASASHSPNPADETTIVWEVETGEVRGSLPDHALSLAFSRDGRLLVAGQAGGWLSVWDISSQQRKAHFRAHAQEIMHVALSPDGRIIATASSDESVALWDAKSLNRLATFPGLGGEVWSVGFSPDGRRLAAGTRRNVVRLWDMESRQQVGTFASAGGTLVHFRADGDSLLTCGGRMFEGGMIAHYLIDLTSWLAPSFQEIDSADNAHASDGGRGVR